MPCLSLWGSNDGRACVCLFLESVDRLLGEGAGLCMNGWIRAHRPLLFPLQLHHQPTNPKQVRLLRQHTLSALGKALGSLIDGDGDDYDTVLSPVPDRGRLQRELRLSEG